MKKLVIILFFISIIHASTQPALAKHPSENSVIMDFLDTLFTEGERKASSYVESKVEIPQVRENTPIGGFAVTYPKVPFSSNENKRIAIGYFNDGIDKPERIAFIWEVTLKRGKISAITVVLDGSNPMMNELIMVKEYEEKNHKKIFVPSDFPFAITHVDGYIDNDTLMLRYRNEELKGTLQIKIVPSNHIDIDRLKGKYDRYYTLKDGTKALYQPNFDPAYQIVFNKNELRYYVGINKNTEKNITVEDVIKVANSMLIN